MLNNVFKAKEKFWRIVNIKIPLMGFVYRV